MRRSIAAVPIICERKIAPVPMSVERSIATKPNEWREEHCRQFQRELRGASPPDPKSGVKKSIATGPDK